MGEAKVTLSLTDLTNRVQSAGGYYGAIVIPAKKGAIGVPTLVTNDTQLLDRYTPDSKIEVGFDLAFYSAKAFLLRSNKLWVTRVAGTGFKYGAVEVVSSTSANVSAPPGIVPAVTESAEVTFTSLSAATSVTVGGMTYTAHATTETTSSTVLAAAFIAGTATTVGTGALTITDAVEKAKWTRATGSTASKAVFTSVTPYTNVADLASTGTGAAHAVVVVTAGSNGGSATGIESSAVDGTGTAYTFSADGLFLLYGIDEGAWNNDLSVTITTDSTVKAPAGAYAFVIRVYYKGALKETWTASRVVGQKDGYGKTMNLVDLLKGSKYIRAYENALATNKAVLPKANSVAISCGGGDDGAVVSDADIILGYEQYENEVYPVTFLMDGGNASQEVHQALLTQAETYLDRYAILSMPYAAESASDYITAIDTYVNTTLGTGSYLGGIYSSWVNIYDADNDRTITVSPDGYVAALFSEAATNSGHLYVPVAGFNMGNLSLLGVSSLYRNYTSGERDTLSDMGVNVLRFFPGRGNIIWGQKTLFGTPSALLFANVAGLLIEIRPAIMDYLNELLFEIQDFTNDKGVRYMVRTRIESYLDQFIPNGMYGRKVLCDDTNNTAEDVDNGVMNVWVFIKPARDIEEIPFKTILTPTSVSFDLAVSSTIINSLA